MEIKKIITAFSVCIVLSNTAMPVFAEVIEVNQQDINLSLAKEEPVNKLFWGTSEYEFDEQSGVITIGPGSLGVFGESPWNRNDSLKIDADKIKKIKLTEKTIAPSNSTRLFSKSSGGLSKLESFEGLSNLDTSNVENMSYMFNSSTVLRQLDISNFDTSKVTNMNMMFNGVKLEKLVLGEHFKFGEGSSLSAPTLGIAGNTLTGKWIREDGKSKAYTPSEFTSLYGSGDLTPGVYVAEILGSVWGDAPWIFEEESGLLTVGSGNLGLSGESPWNRKDNLKIAADKIKKIKLTGKNVAPVNSSSLFGNLKNVETIEGLSNLDTSNVENMSSMFTLMSSLSTLDVSHFDTRKVTNMGSMFNGMKLKSLKLGEYFRFIESNSLGAPIVGVEGVTLTGKWVREDGKSKAYTPSEFTSLYGSGDLTPGVYVAEILGSVWGDAPWTFEEESGLLTVGSGNLGLSGESPWNRNDNLQVNFELIKKIKFTGKAVAPANSTRLFSRALGGLSKLESFEGLSNLDTSKVENMSYMFNSSTALRQLDISSFDTRKVTSMSLMFNSVTLEKLVLGEHFKFGEGSSLSAPTLGIAGNTLTGKWIREDGKSKAYTPSEFTSLYGSGDLTPGVYVAEILGSVWGDAPWIFEEESGLLTVGSGNLGLSGESPWNRKDNLKIAADKIKKIKLTGKNVAPVNSSSLFGNLKNVETIEGLSNLDTSNVENMSSMFTLMSSLSTLDVSHFDTRKVTNMNRLFNGVGKVETVDITSFNTLSVTDMGSMFSGMKLKSLKLGEHFRFIESNNLGTPILGEEGVILTGKWVREDGKSKAYTPSEFTSLYGSGDLTPGIYVAEILGSVWGDAPWTFEEESGLLTVGSGNLGLSGISPWNRKDNLKIDIDKIKKIKLIGKNVAPVNSSNLFSKLVNVERIEGLSNLDISKVENMSSMFKGSESLTDIDIDTWNTKNVTSMVSLFEGCTAISFLEISGFDTSKTTLMTNMFKNLKGSLSIRTDELK